MPELPTDLDVRGALGIKVDNLAGKRTGLVGVNRNIKEGTRVASRLDINGYTEYNKWIATLTVPKAKIKEFVKNNPNLSPTSYARAVHLKNVDLKQSESLQKKSLDIASGRAKGPHAVMEGDFLANDPKDVYDYAKEIFEQKPKEWVQVGYNPIRAGFFYERGTGLPIESAEEIIQVGPLVLAKNVVGGSIRDYFFNKGGDVMEKQMEMAFMNEGGVLKDDGMNKDPVSGNEVPSGSMAKEVRDDIPAQLSEGEYVVPADVVRFHGVQKFEDLRDQAKKGFGAMEADGRIGGQPVDDDFPIPVDQLQTYDEGGDVDTYEKAFGQKYTPGQRYGSTFGPRGTGFELINYTSPDGKRTIVIPHYNGKPMSAVPEGFAPQGGSGGGGIGVSDPTAGERDRQEAENEAVQRRNMGQPVTIDPLMQAQLDKDRRLTEPKAIENFTAQDYTDYYNQTQGFGIDDIARNVPILGGLLSMQDDNIRKSALKGLQDGTLKIDDDKQFNAVKSLITTAPQQSFLARLFGVRQDFTPPTGLPETFADYQSQQASVNMQSEYEKAAGIGAFKPVTIANTKKDLYKVPDNTVLSPDNATNIIRDMGKDMPFKGTMSENISKAMLGIREKDGAAIVSTPKTEENPKGEKELDAGTMQKFVQNAKNIQDTVLEKTRDVGGGDSGRPAGSGPPSVQEIFNDLHGFDKGGLATKPKPKPKRKRTTKKGLGVKTKAT